MRAITGIQSGQQWPNDFVHSSMADPCEEQPMPASQQASKFLSALIVRAQTGPELIQGIAGFLVRSGAQGVWLVSYSAQGHWQAPVPLVEELGPILDIVSAAMHSALEKWHGQAAGANLVCADIREIPSTVMIIAPVIANDRISDAIVVLAPSASRSGIPIDWMTSLSAAALSSWQTRSYLAIHKEQLALLGGMLGMTASLNRTTSELETAITLVNEIKGVTRSTQAALLIKGHGQTMKLTAVSDVEHLDSQSRSALLIESIVSQLPESLIVWKKDASPATGDGQLLPSCELDDWNETFGTQAVVLMPLKDARGQVNAWAVAGFEDASVLTGAFLKHLENINTIVGGHFDVVMRNHRTVKRLAIENSRRWLRQRWVRITAIAMGVVAMMMIVPFKYNVPCECQLQLVSRRFVAAPYEGLLEKTLVNGGDVVTAGQVLACMDARQLRMELSSISAEMDSQRKHRDSALAKGNVAESQIANSEMSRLDSKTNILKARLENTDIRSPLDGVVISGDLEKAEGVPMELGQTLFEVGPLEKMLVEIHIPEREIRMVSVGMPVQFEFDAFPFQTFEGTLQRIHPRAESLESKSVFVGEIEIENTDGQLRPGLKGRARIRGNRYPLGWNLFHHTWDSARRWIVW